MAERFTFRTRIDAPPEAVAEWHKNPLALERLSPPFDGVERDSDPESIREGMIAKLKMSVGPVKQRWTAEHKQVARLSFVDEQVSGPFRMWRHAHRFLPDGTGACVLEDDVAFALPLAPASAPALPWVKQRLTRTFRYRHDVTAGDVLALHDKAPRRIAITGATGFIGRTLVPYLRATGSEVLILRRAGSKRRLPKGWGTEVDWDPSRAELDPALEGVDAVIHLAGENVAGRWNDEQKRRILQSRHQGTETLAAGLAALKSPPGAFVSASGVAYYGDGGEAVLEERSSSGHGFLSDVCRAWEGAAEPLVDKGVRTVHLRIGMVLGAHGGALAQMMLPWRMGLGSVLGSGEQWVSWISVDDLLDVIARGVWDDALVGAVNAVTDRPVRQKALAQTLGRVLRRPVVATLPSQVVRTLFGELADEGLLCSQRVKPSALLARGHRFRHPSLESALRHVVGR